jgi:hypothetical protein
MLVSSLVALSGGAAAAGFAPETLHRVQAYDDPGLPREEVAILFATDGRPKYESASICAIDGISLERDGVCASVVYARPGIHRLKLRYRSDSQFGTGRLTLEVAANRLYQVNFSSLRIGYAGVVNVIPMPEGAKLTWRNLAPGLAAGHSRIDEAVPYAANSERGDPPPTTVLSDADRATVAHLLECAGKFAVDVELRKFDHQEYASQYGAVGAFVEAALTYVSEEDALEGQQVAARAAMPTYAPARVPQDTATEASTRARAQLKVDLQICTDFYSANASERAARTQGRPK